MVLLLGRMTGASNFQFEMIVSWQLLQKIIFIALESFRDTMENREVTSAKRQSYYFMLIPHSIGLVNPQPGITEANIKFALLRGFQIFNQTKSPVKVNFQRTNEKGLVPLQKVELSFFIRNLNAHPNNNFVFIVKNVDEEQNEKQFGNMTIFAPKLAEGFAVGKKQVKKSAIFGPYKLDFYIFVDSDRFELQKTIKAFKDQKEKGTIVEEDQDQEQQEEEQKPKKRPFIQNYSPPKQTEPQPQPLVQKQQSEVRQIQENQHNKNQSQDLGEMNHLTNQNKEIEQANEEQPAISSEDQPNSQYQAIRPNEQNQQIETPQGITDLPQNQQPIIQENIKQLPQSPKQKQQSDKQQSAQLKEPVQIPIQSPKKQQTPELQKVNPHQFEKPQEEIQNQQQQQIKGEKEKLEVEGDLGEIEEKKKPSHDTQEPQQDINILQQLQVEEKVDHPEPQGQTKVIDEARKSQLMYESGMSASKAEKQNQRSAFNVRIILFLIISSFLIFYAMIPARKAPSRRAN